MAIKSSNVVARVEPEIKEEAEAILAQLGISASNGINVFYRPIILWRGLPFQPSVPASRPLSLDEMTKEGFDAKMARGLAQARAGEGVLRVIETGDPPVLCLLFYKLIILPEAQQDIRDIVLYIARELASMQAALDLQDEFEKEIKSLAKMPKRIKTVDEQLWKDAVIRRTKVKLYLFPFGRR